MRSYPRAPSGGWLFPSVADVAERMVPLPLPLALHLPLHVCGSGGQRPRLILPIFSLTNLNVSGKLAIAPDSTAAGCGTGKAKLWHCTKGCRVSSDFE